MKNSKESTIRKLIFRVLISIITFSCVMTASNLKAEPTESCDQSYSGLSDPPIRIYGVPKAAILYKTLNHTGGQYEFNLYRNRYDRFSRDRFNDRRGAYSKWQDIANSVGLNPQLESGRSWSDKCVYQSAIDTFETIKKQLGRDTPYLHRWVANQLQVFKVCVDGNPKGSIEDFHPLIDPHDPTRAHFDRQYQEASYHFYAKDFSKAGEDYRKIFSNPKNPYRGLAGYMIARVLRADNNSADAYSQLMVLEKDPTLSAYYPLYNEYRFVIGYYSCAGEILESCYNLNVAHLTFLRNNILNIGNGDNADKDYHDSVEQLQYYLQSMPGAANKWWFSPNDADSPRLLAYENLATTDSFLDWMQVYSATNFIEHDWSWYLYMGDDAKRVQDSTIDHALKRWKAGDGDSWLYLAALRMYPTHPALAEVKDAVQKLYDQHKCGKSFVDQAYAELWPHLFFMKVADSLSDSLIQELIDSYKDNSADSEVTGKLVRFLLHKKRYSDIQRLGEAFIKSGKYDRDLFKIYLNFLKSPADAFALISSLDASSFHGYRRWRSIDPERDLNNVSLHIADRLSVNDLLDMLEKNLLPQEIKAQMARVSFVRAVLLDDKKAFVRAAYQVANLRPFPKNDIATMLDAAHGRPDAWQVAEFLLKHPRYNVYATDVNIEVSDHNYRDIRKGQEFDGIDTYNHNDNNWWCKLDPDKAEEDAVYYLFDEIYWPYKKSYDYRHGPLKYLVTDLIDDEPHAIEKAENDFYTYSRSDEWIADNELKVLAGKPNGPQYLTEKSIELANSENGFIKRWLRSKGLHFAENPAVPEMLHLSEVTARYGCNRNGSHRAYSKDAYKILYQYYPDSAWTKLTPYWFN